MGPTLVSLQAGHNNQDNVGNTQGCNEDKAYQYKTKNEGQGDIKAHRNLEIE
jgi:hypothetical protein